MSLLLGRGILTWCSGFLAEGGGVGGARRRVTRADLEAMLGEFDIIERYADAESTVEVHLHQVWRNARLGLSLEE